ncbi:2-isopropylmalate synthase [Novimethylophilus kurashikiensis]|uniref:2-isopropylmalate synthase n=1 Tax=Novimethylophilus kurashikiensis TaxID=1825523 RepID=A0A2R5F7P1_9PROT|nr:hypothetical protein [Novimethylophilus kurashikiensis]GBG14260.1 2-isopropylmalate synthase [Novimethylophilus kurashikiensis]
MKAIVLVHRDGGRHLAFVKDSKFDTQAWASSPSRKASFNLLGIVKVEEHYH